MSVTIPDDFPSAWVLKACQQTGTYTGNDVYRNILPALITRESSITVTGIIGAMITNIVNGLCVFYTLVLLFPSIANLRWIVFGITMVPITIIPSIVSIVYYSSAEAGIFDDSLNTPAWSWGAYILSLTFFITVGCIFIYGVSAYLMTGDGSWVTLAILLLFIMPVSKTLFPVIALLCGPSVMPVLFGISFLEYCGTT